MTLGEKIQQLRQDQNISQKELAEKLEVSTADIAVWESNESIPSISNIAKLSSVFGVTTDTLIMNNDIIEDTHKNTIHEETEKETHSIKEQSVKKIHIPKKKLAVLIPVVVVLIAIIGVFAYKIFMPFSKNTIAIEKAASSVVKIYCYDYEGNESATGSGFIAFDDRTIVTNYHVMEEAYTCKISTEEDKTYEVESILAYSQEQDLAILRLKESPRLKVLKLSNSDKTKKGETVTAIGSPLGIKNTVSQGVLSGRLMEENMDVLQFTAAISSGSSGGALFNEKGKVIGVTYASFIDGQNLNLAIPAEMVSALVNGALNSDPYNVSEIYLRAHPYILYTEEFSDAITVTMEDLKKNPEIYDNQIIKMESYISSVLDLNGNLFAVNRAENISNDFINDSIKNFDDTYRISSLMLVTSTDRSLLKYRDTTIQAGDKVIVVGKFVFDAIGEKVYSILHDKYITRTTEDGCIDTIVIYKVD